jgi:hypothetical protein
MVGLIYEIGASVEIYYLFIIEDTIEETYISLSLYIYLCGRGGD